MNTIIETVLTPMLGYAQGKTVLKAAQKGIPENYVIRKSGLHLNWDNSLFSPYSQGGLHIKPCHEEIQAIKVDFIQSIGLKQLQAKAYQSPAQMVQNPLEPKRIKLFDERVDLQFNWRSKLLWELKTELWGPEECCKKQHEILAKAEEQGKSKTKLNMVAYLPELLLVKETMYIFHLLSMLHARLAAQMGASAGELAITIGLTHLYSDGVQNLADAMVAGNIPKARKFRLADMQKKGWFDYTESDYKYLMNEK